ncbi:MAG: hypothetical protein HZR80_19690 [Candidatus Heimdallarchaeota archaeon]
MLEPDLGEISSKETLKESLEAFNKIKTSIQDRILERTSAVSEIGYKEIAKELKVPEEIAKVIYVLEYDYDVPRKLSADYFTFEEKRLKKTNYELPDIYSFCIRFAMEEGFWIKYIANDFSKKMLRKVAKLITLDRSLFGDLAGDMEDSALYIIERYYIINKTIKPVIVSWVKEHQSSSYYEAAKYIVSGMRHKSMKKAKVIIDELYNRLKANIDSLKFIILELETKGWANKAISEFKVIHQSLETCTNDKTQMNLRIASELILENRLIEEYESLDLKTEIDHPMTQMIDGKKVMGNVGFVAKKDEIITDKFTLIITNIEELSDEQAKPIIKELIDENFEVATKVNHQKPSIFAKEFFERMMIELGISSDKVSKFLKQFDVQLMNRLSPVGSKEFPNLSVDEKVLLLLEEKIMEIIQQKAELRKETDLKKAESLPSHPGIRNKVRAQEATEETVKPSLRSKIMDSSEKDLWIMVRDEYLKELFDNPEELIAGAKVLKKYSLELGLLLTESEAKTTITQELKKNGLTPTDANKEELDLTICKIIFTQIKERKEFS